MDRHHSRKTSRTAKRKEHKKMVIVCEGETEIIYFKNYKKFVRNELEIKTPSTNDTDPVSLVEFALSQIERFELNLRKGDSVWCVFDCDANTDKQARDQQISKAKKKATPKKIKICFSNPCFELWFLLHFDRLSVDSQLTKEVLFSRLSKNISDYKKTSDYFESLSPKMETACQNAKHLVMLHEQNDLEIIGVDSNPSTLVFQIVEDIQKFIQNEKQV